MIDNQNAEGTETAGLLRLRRAQLRLSRLYALIHLGLFAAFVVALVTAQDWMGSRIADDSEITLGLLLAFLLIVVSVLLTGAYLKHSERDIKPLHEEIRREARR